ncbi:MAG: hypothetical protein NT154_02135, partial [Verrucomicrobia bacterium]|nr:hypothetical protein [Verrucomicrobiota bacterium]
LNQTATNLAIASLKAADEGVYSVLVTNRGGSASNVAWTIHVAGEGSPIWWGGGTQSWSCLQGVHDVSALAVGSAHYLAARDNGMILAWGDNTSGQTNVPLNMSNVVGVAAGDAHSLALKADGTVVAWGSNTSNQTNVPPGLTNVTAIAAGGNQSLALRQDGTVVQWGLTNTAIPAWVTNVTAIASGSNFNLALLRNTTVAAWGANDYGKTNLPANLSNVVAIAAGAWHGLAVKSNGNVVAWGLNTSGQAPVSLALSNVMAVAGGAAHSMALKNDGTVVAWGSTNAGQTTVPSWLGPVKLLGAGGNQSLVSMFSPLVQYPVDVTKDLLLIYNTNSLDSSNVCAYYLQHRPMAGGANVLGIACPTNELINTSTFNNQINASIQIWLAGNPTKHPQYIILFPDLPTRVWGNVSDPNTIVGSVAYGLSTNTVGIRPFVTSINMRDFDSSRPATNACIAYIDKLAFFGTNYSPGKLVISPSCRNYWNTNYLVDDVGWYAPGIFYGITNALLDAGVPPASITYLTANEPCVLWDADTNCIQRQAMPHITNAMNVASYDCWGVYSTLGSRYAITGVIKWQGNSGWWVIETHESANGIQQSGVGNYWTWFDYSSFGGTNYENTPVGAVSNTDEPYGYGGTYPNIYFGLWARGKSFAISAWNAIKTSRFQAVGDPFVVR